MIIKFPSLVQHCRTDLIVLALRKSVIQGMFEGIVLHYQEFDKFFKLGDFSTAFTVSEFSPYEYHLKMYNSTGGYLKIL